MSALPTFFGVLLMSAAATEYVGLRGADQGTPERKLSLSNLPSRVGGLLGLTGDPFSLHERGSDSDIAGGVQWKATGPTMVQWVYASDAAKHIWFMKHNYGGLWHMDGIGAVPQAITVPSEGGDMVNIALSSDGSVLYTVHRQGNRRRVLPGAIYRMQTGTSKGPSGQFVKEEIPDRLATCDGGPNGVATSGDGSHVWATNKCYEVFYKGPGQPTWARHEGESARVYGIVVSRNGNHVWARSAPSTGNFQSSILYHPGQFSGTTGWRTIDSSRNWIGGGLSVSGDGHVFASDRDGNVFYFNQEGDTVKLENIVAPKMFELSAYTLATVSPEQLEFGGEWNWIGLGIQSREMRAVTSWSTTEDQSVTESFTWGLSQSVTVEGKTNFILADSKVSVTAGSSQDWGESVTSTVSNMQGGQNWFSCGSLSCTTGNLYQWVIKGTSSTGHEEKIEQCSFVCVPSATRDQPKCPPRYCGDAGPCQCCNGQYAEGGNPPASPLCTAISKRSGNSAGMCLGCD